MRDYEVEVKGEAREVYVAYRCFDAKEAEDRFKRGELTKPILSEVTGAEVVAVREAPMEAP